MAPSRFYTALAGTALLCAALFSLPAVLLPDWMAHWPLALITGGAFIALSIGLYIAGTQLARSSNLNAFNMMISVSVFGKMVLAIALLYLYQAAFQPQNQWFVGVFLLFYVVFTVFEVWFMTVLAKTKKS